MIMWAIQDNYDHLMSNPSDPGGPLIPADYLTGPPGCNSLTGYSINISDHTLTRTELKALITQGNTDGVTPQCYTYTITQGNNSVTVSGCYIELDQNLQDRPTSSNDYIDYQAIPIWREWPSQVPDRYNRFFDSATAGSVLGVTLPSTYRFFCVVQPIGTTVDFVTGDLTIEYPAVICNTTLASAADMYFGPTVPGSTLACNTSAAIWCAAVRGDSHPASSSSPA